MLQLPESPILPEKLLLLCENCKVLTMSFSICSLQGLPSARFDLLNPFQTKSRAREDKQECPQNNVVKSKERMIFILLWELSTSSWYLSQLSLENTAVHCFSVFHYCELQAACRSNNSVIGKSDNLLSLCKRKTICSSQTLTTFGCWR